MSPIVLDTDVASSLLRRRTPPDTLGRLAGHTQLRGRPRPANDSWIAACCPVRALPLATFNTKDFVDFAEHEGLALLGE